MRRAFWLAGLAFWSCTSGVTDAPPGPGLPAGEARVALDVSPVPLNPEDRAQRAVGAFVYAGGIEIHAAGNATLHELSDLVVLPGDRLMAVTDRGELFQARFVLDDGRLAGLADASLARLVDREGAPLEGQVNVDAEGLALMGNGDRLVSFERDHRIWLYPADGGLPRPATWPEVPLPDNAGFEALTASPSDGPKSYLVGSEGGTVWRCELSAACSETTLGTMLRAGLGLVALSAYGGDGHVAMLGRAYDPAVGNGISLKLVGLTDDGQYRVLDELRLTHPLTRDNFEGVAVVPRADGALRIYLLSDDNGSATQRTYLLAFDWMPGS